MNFKDYKEQYYYQPSTIVKGQSIFKKTNLAGITTHCSHWKDNKCESIRGENKADIYLYIPCIWFNLLPVYPFPKDTFGSKQRQGVGEGYIKRYMYLFPNLLREMGQLTSLLHEIKYNTINFVKHQKTQNYNMYRIITNDFRTEAIFFFHR